MIPLKDIYDAIKLAVEECGSESELARRCNLNPKVINLCMNKKVRRITDEKWLKLEPNIRKYLPAGTSFTQVNHGSTVYQSALGDVGVLQKSDFVSRKDLISRILSDARLDDKLKLVVIELING